MKRPPLAIAAPALMLLVGTSDLPRGALLLDSGKCTALAGLALDAPKAEGAKISGATWREAGTTVETRGGNSAPLPAHCEITGKYGEHVGRVGGPYRTQFHMRLPAQWNGRYFFQGGGGSNGVVGDALGSNGPGNPTAIERGYAVISQDSGHDNAVNRLASHGNELVFGHDPVARANYGHASLKPSYDLGMTVLRAAYRRAPDTKIFWGCSKGGQEGMAFAQRYPRAFDGIVAAAPGFSLPRAAVAEAWDIQQLASILRASGQLVTPDALKTAITAGQMKLVADVVRDTCDADDGIRDGIIAAVGQCTSGRILPVLRRKTCVVGKAADCLSGPQITALGNIMQGPRNRAGKALYADWAWDIGMAEPGWQVWKMGLEKGPPALNLVLGGGSLAAVFITPPTLLPADPAQILAWQLAFDFDRDARKIYATDADFRNSAWTDIGMRSPELSAFRAHGGKMIVPHGVSDPVFSVLDTLNWWEEVNRRSKGKAANFARVFPVPGMNHCGGGAATDRYDSLSALENWVLNNKAPSEIRATAGATAPWPGRERLLCPWPSIARATRKGGFACVGSGNAKS